MLNQRAADWFEEQGDAESTLDYSHAAGNADSAARILSSIAMPMSSCGPRRGRRVAGSTASTTRRYSATPRSPWRGRASTPSAGGRRRPRPGWRLPSAARRKNGKGAVTRACIDVLRAAMCADGPERMLKQTTSALAALPHDHPWRPWALVVNGTAHLLLGDDERADSVFAAAGHGPHAAPRAALGAQRALAARRGARRRAGRDAGAGSPPPDRGARARRLPDAALDLAATARALLRHGRWDEARRQLTITQRLAPCLTHAIPWLSVQVRLELGRAYVTLRDRNARAGAARRGPRDPGAAARARSPRRAGRGARSRDRGDAARPLAAARSGLTPRRAAPAAAPFDPPLVPRDRRAPVRLAQHDQDPGDLRLPQARRLEPQRRDRQGARARPRRRGVSSAAESRRRRSVCRSDLRLGVQVRRTRLPSACRRSSPRPARSTKKKMSAPKTPHLYHAASTSKNSSMAAMPNTMTTSDQL